ncbi:hypothetical protein Pyn_35158 [Prunus yedoensis var. nudiflora]|uniref:Uncharacterized protein n=1 Tax=Prunus yedoensis var. nudiflora TaxID=2094558 RepID=A0A314YK39_PRUYE|nr:hypothetical protein Pyn_35158 [Prunus yedoensis var. nudiflora]
MSVYTFPLQWEIGSSNCPKAEDDFLHAESSHLDGDQVAMVSDGVSDLQDLRRIIKAIEKAMVEKERHFSANQISECSSYGISRRDTIEADGQMLELWETTD